MILSLMEFSNVIIVQLCSRFRDVWKNMLKNNMVLEKVRHIHILIHLYILSTYNICLLISFIYFKGYNKEFEKFAQNETDETNKDESGISLLNDATDDGDQESKGMLRFSIFF